MKGRVTLLPIDLKVSGLIADPSLGVLVFFWQDTGLLPVSKLLIELLRLTANW